MTSGSYQADIAQTAVITLRGIGGDVTIEGQDGSTLSIESTAAIDSYLRRDDDSVRVQDFPGSLTIRAPRTAQIALQGIGGEARVARVAQAKIDAIGGNTTVEQVEEAVIGQVGRNLQVTGTRAVQVRGVGGSATIEQVERLNGIGHIGGQLTVRAAEKLQIEGDQRGTVGGSATIELPKQVDLTLSVITGGRVSGHGEGWEFSGSTGRHQLVFGQGTAQLRLTIGGSLTVTGGSEMTHTEGQSWSGEREEWGQFGDDMRMFGRDLEELGRTLARDLSSLGREIAREVRIAGREATRGMYQQAPGGGPRPRVHVRVNDREFNLDPDQVERIKREARAAAASGIAKAQEAVERALQQWQQATPPRPPQPPRPPRPGQSSYTGQTVRIDREAAGSEQPAAEAPRDLDAERIAILRMVHEGRLAPDEAETLLRGLDNR